MRISFSKFAITSLGHQRKNDCIHTVHLHCGTQERSLHIRHCASMGGQLMHDMIIAQLLVI